MDLGLGNLVHASVEVRFLDDVGIALQLVGTRLLPLRLPSQVLGLVHLNEHILPARIR